MPDIRTLSLPPSRLHRIAEMLRPFSIATQVAHLHGLSPLKGLIDLTLLDLASTMPTPLSGIYVPSFLIYRLTSNEEQP